MSEPVFVYDIHTGTRDTRFLALLVKCGDNDPFLFTPSSRSWGEDENLVKANILRSSLPSLTGIDSETVVTHRDGFTDSLDIGVKLAKVLKKDEIAKPLARFLTETFAGKTVVGLNIERLFVGLRCKHDWDHLDARYVCLNSHFNLRKNMRFSFETLLDFMATHYQINLEPFRYDGDQNDRVRVANSIPLAVNLMKKIYEEMMKEKEMMPQYPIRNQIPTQGFLQLRDRLRNLGLSSISGSPSVMQCPLGISPYAYTDTAS